MTLEQDRVTNLLRGRYSRRDFLIRAGVGGAMVMGLPAIVDACTGSTSAATGGNVHLVWTSNSIATVLDPAIGNATNQWVYGLSVYEGLYEYGPGGYDLRPALATSHTLSSDGLTYTFKLRSGVVFHDGAKFDAQAVVTNIQRMQAVAQGPSQYVALVTNVVAKDAGTVAITLSKPYHYFPQVLPWVLMASPDAIAKNKTSDDPWAKKWFAANEAGTGPYKMDSFQLNQTIKLSKNQHYWRSFDPNTPIAVTMLQVVEPTTRLEQLQSGEADISGSGLAPSDYLSAEQLSNVKLFQRPGVVERTLQLNMQNTPTSDPIFRQALVAAFDYAGFEKYYNGFGKTGNGPIPTSLAGANKSLPTPTQDLDKAKSLLQQGGYLNKNIELTYISVAGANVGTVAGTLLQGALRPFGINVQTHSLPFAQIPPLMTNPKNYHVGFLNGWPETADPSSLLTLFYSSINLPNKGGFNWSWYDRPDLEQQLATALQGTDESSIQQTVSQIEGTIVADNPTVFAIIDDTVQPVRKEWLNGVSYDPWMGIGGIRFFFTKKGA